LSSALKAVKRWAGEGRVGAPDADILLEAIEELWKPAELKFLKAG